MRVRDPLFSSLLSSRCFGLHRERPTLNTNMALNPFFNDKSRTAAFDIILNREPKN